MSLKRHPRRLAFGAILLASVAFAAGERTKVRLERIDATDFPSDGKIKVYASVMELEGTVVDDKPQGMFILSMNGKTVGPPEKMARFQTSNEPLDLVLVLETSALYGPQKPVVAPPPPKAPPKGVKGVKGPAPKAPPVPKEAKGSKKKRALPPAPDAGKPKKSAFQDDPIDKVKDAAKSLLEAMNPKWRVLVIDYGGDVTPHHPFRNAGAALSTVDDLSTDEESGDLRLSGAVQAALIELNKPRPEGEVTPRRLMVMVSDGLNTQMDRKTFKMLGDQAQKAGVPIHTIAFSPNDDRGPLLNLGEISKRSNGTFRWAKNGDELRGQIETLVDELNKQYVLTYSLKTDLLIGKHFTLQVEDLTSNELIFGAVKSVDVSDDGRRRLPWWVWVLAALGAVGAVFGIITFLRWRKEASATKKVEAQTKAKAQAQKAQQQSAVRAAAPQPIAAGTAQRATIIVIGGALAGQRMEVNATSAFIVGKAGGTLHVTDDPTVSSQHAQIYFSQGAIVLQDLGSTNGTFVNNVRVTQMVALKDGDLVRFGNTQVKIRVD